MKRGAAGLACALGLSLSTAASAEPEPSREPGAPDAPPPATATASPAPAAASLPAVHHAPHLTATEARDLTIEATIERPDLVKRAVLVYRGGGTHGEVELARSSSAQGYAAVIPATAVKGALAYAIELETTSGARLPAFATRATPHPVTVLDDVDDRAASATLARLGGRRSVVETSAEYASFGDVTTTLRRPGAPPRTFDTPDHFYRFEGAYTYRLLGIVSEFGIRAGAVRGESVVEGETDPSKYQVGLNYGAPRVRLRAAEWLHFEAELLTSVTEVGFSVGGGGAVLVGDPYGTKMVFGAEGIQVFGARGYTRLDLAANRRLMVSPIVEVTGMPHAESAGVRLLGEARVDLGAGFGLVARGGYQARTFNRGGPTVGAGLSFAF
ncbi:MAG TPA: hypothetical protein PLR99_08255 [Polyangiaceae bacterium]|nr:hypothetical protein [Polyangiaceae bacterium]